MTQKNITYAIRKTLLGVGSLAIGATIATAPVLHSGAVLLAHATSATATSQGEVPSAKYSMTGNVDLNNSIAEGSNAQSKSHTTQIKISIPDTTGIKGGDYISFKIDGFNFSPGADVRSGNTIIGRLSLQEGTATDMTKLAKTNDLAEASKIEDGKSSSNQGAVYRLTFNKNIENIAKAEMTINNTGSQTYAAANHSRTETMKITDATGRVISEKSFVIPSGTRTEPAATGYNAESLNEWRVATTLNNKNTDTVSSNFAVSLIDEAREQDKYLKGTVITYTLKDNPYFSFDKGTLVGSDGTPLTKGSIVTTRNIGSPVTTSVGKVTPNGYYYGVNNVLSFEVLEVNDKGIKIKLLEDLQNVGTEYHYFGNFSYSLSEYSNNTHSATGDLLDANKPVWTITVDNAAGLSNTIDHAPNIQNVGISTNYTGEARFKTRLDIVNPEGQVIKANAATSAALAAGTSYTLTGPDTVVVGEKTYYPVAGKVKTGLTDRNVPVVTLTYQLPEPINPGTKYVADPNLPAGTKQVETTPEDGERVGTQTLKEPRDEVIRVGTKPTTREIEFERKVVEDPTKPLTYREVTTPGIKGLETTTYTLNDKTGEVTPTTTMTRAKQDEITTVGVGANKPIPFNTTYVGDPELEQGKTVVDNPGKDGEADVTGKTITEPENKVVRVGLKPTTREIDFERKIVEDPTKPLTYREVTTPGIKGIETTTYTLNERTGEVTPTTTMTRTKQDEITTVGVGKNQKIPFTTTYVGDPNLEQGKTVVDTPGKDGEADVTGKELTPPTTQVVRVGLKPTTREIPYDTKEVLDTTKPLTYREVTTKGVKGVETTTYKLNEQTGEVTSTTSMTTQKVDEVITVGAGADSDIPQGKKYVEDPDMENGKTVTDSEGEPGTQDVTGRVIKDPVDGVVRIGTKPTTREIPFDTKTVEDPTKPPTYREVTTPGVKGVETTTYKVNPKTGEVTPTTTVTKEKVDEVITIGVGANVPIPFTTRYVPDDTLEVGESSVDHPGKDGLKDIEGKVLENPEDKVVRVGTKPKTREVPFDTKIVEDPTKPPTYREVTTPGVVGVETTTYTIDEKTGEVKATTSITTQKVDEVITIGTGENSPIPHGVKYVADPELPAGESVVDNPGKDGLKDVEGKVLEEPEDKVIRVGTKSTTREVPFDSKTVEDPTKPPTYREITTVGVVGIETTTYELSKDGELVAKVTVTKEKVDEVITIGTGANTPIPHGVKYIEDPTLPVGETRVDQPGKDGLKDVEGKVLEEPQDKIVRVGTKPTTKVEEVPFKTQEVKNPELPVGEVRIKQSGKLGTITTTSKFTVDPATGKVTETKEVSEVAPVDEIIEVGTKEAPKPDSKAPIATGGGMSGVIAPLATVLGALGAGVAAVFTSRRRK